MVIIDRQGIIRETRTERFGEVNSPKYPRNKAWTLRLQALGRLLRYAYHHRVGIVVYEDLFKIKRRIKKTKNRSGNRKANRFPKRKLLEYAITMALKYNFKVYLVNPSYTSRLAEKIKDRFGLDKHTVSAYLLGLRYLNPETYKRLLDRDT
ncbi:MAG TPA: transposase, partial [Thermoprotei archaeon]|nr:transposase [Thermoprotei archaeon]